MKMLASRITLGEGIISLQVQGEEPLLPVGSVKKLVIETNPFNLAIRQLKEYEIEEKILDEKMKKIIEEFDFVVHERLKLRIFLHVELLKKIRAGKISWIKLQGRKLKLNKIATSFTGNGLIIFTSGKYKAVSIEELEIKERKNKR